MREGKRLLDCLGRAIAEGTLVSDQTDCIDVCAVHHVNQSHLMRVIEIEGGRDDNPAASSGLVTGAMCQAILRCIAATSPGAGAGGLGIIGPGTRPRATLVELDTGVELTAPSIR